MNGKKALLAAVPLGLVVAAAAFFGGRGGGDAKPMPDSSTPRPIAWLKDASGNVLVGGSGGGQAASSRSPIAGRDQLATEIGARAVVELRRAGTLVVGSKAAMQVLDEDWDGPRLRPTRVRFLRGTLRADARTDTDGMIIDLGDRVIELAPGGSAFFAWADDALAISMLKAGGVMRTLAGDESVLASGQGVRVPLGGGVAKAMALPAPLKSKGSVREKVWARDGKARPTFRFPGEEGNVQVIVARDEALTEVVADATADAEAVRVEDGIEPGSYFWSAARVDTVSKLTGPFTAPRPLSVLGGNAPPAADESPIEPVVIAGASTRVFFSGATPPELAIDWIGVTDEDSGYVLSVSSDSKLRKLRVQQVVEESRYTLGSLPAGTWHWRVKGPDGKAQGGAFVVKRATGGPVRASRSATVKEEFDKATVFFQREAPSVEFQWKLDARAAKYRLLVSRDKTFPNTLVTREAAKSPIVVEPGLLPEGEVWWRVQRLKADGSVFYPGKVQALAVKFDLENPNLELTEPAEGAKVAGNTVQVTGLAPRDSAIWVNGQPVAPDRRGRFSVQATVEPADPLVVVKTARGGKDFSYFVRTLSR